MVVAENHSSVGGLCEAVASLLMRNRINVDFDTVALPDAFLDAGALPTLHDRYGISTAAMVEKSVAGCDLNRGETDSPRSPSISHRIHPPALHPLHAAAIGLRHGGRGHARKAREEAVVGVGRFGEYRRANQVDTDPARQLAGGGADKAFQRGVYRGGVYPRAIGSWATMPLIKVIDPPLFR